MNSYKYKPQDVIFDVRKKLSLKKDDLHPEEYILDPDHIFDEPTCLFKASVVCVHLRFGEKKSYADMDVLYNMFFEVISNAMHQVNSFIDAFSVGNFVFGIFSTTMKINMTELMDVLGTLNSAIGFAAMKAEVYDLKYVISADFGEVYLNNLNPCKHNWNGDIFDTLRNDFQVEENNNVFIGTYIFENIDSDLYKAMFTKVKGTSCYCSNIISCLFDEYNNN